MKRGLIAWDREALPPAVFDARLAKVRAALAERDLPAVVVYSDVARSNDARFLTNFMPYWNRSLVVIPREGAPVLLCGLSPRVYPWIRSVTVFEEIRPASKLAPSLVEFCEERGWKRLGVLDLPKMPNEVESRLRGLGVIDVSSQGLLEPDEAELAMRARAEKLTRSILEGQTNLGASILDYEFVGRLEREYRRSGAEDVVIRLSSNGKTPRPANGSILTDEYSVVVDLEYLGHWVRVTKAQGAHPGTPGSGDAL
ncbi:MAG TPA: hypothetical protein VGN17_18075 [Bryobacteraceae bacterium]